MHEPVVTLALATEHGLLEEEYARIVEILGRIPTYTELGIFSVMWSEHCSYKNSIAELKKLPRSGKRLLVGAGEENAGLVDIGDGLAVAFKIESHNHPSAVEPYQGAATGVGGIMRDIFTMGARPIASLNSLRFGNPLKSRTQYLIKGIVKGIGDYGNSFGVPTVAGDVFFDDCYNENPLVNAMAVGLVRHDQVAKAVARGKGNLVLIVGSSTGRDGIHGATFASEEISEASESKRPSVQVGDPFTEKLLLEATLEAIQQGLVVGIQDMGAAGIICSTSEMTAKGESGMEVDLDLVHTREPHMSPYEILLSESQERMLVVVRPEHENQLKQVFRKWDLPCETIGKVGDGGRLKISWKGKTVADVPAESLVLGGGAPVYIRESVRPGYLDDISILHIDEISEPADFTASLISLLRSPNISSKRWVFTQYDQMVRGNTAQGRYLDAAVVRIKGTDKAIALKTDCNPRYCYLNPRRGAQIAVAEAARNVVCVGATPLAITNCLNFGNPYKPFAYYQFRESIQGMKEACEILETPVTGGNVSFYNESPDGPIYPTPVIGMLGEIPSISRTMTADFKSAGDQIVLLGKTVGHLGGSEYLKVVHGMVRGDAPGLDLVYEKRLQRLCLELIRDGIVSSMHDLSEGGLAVALVESVLDTSSGSGKPLGVRVQLPTAIRTDAYLFGEDQSRVLTSVAPGHLRELYARSENHQIDANLLGEVTNDGLATFGSFIRVEVGELQEVYDTAIERIMNES